MLGWRRYWRFSRKIEVGCGAGRLFLTRTFCNTKTSEPTRSGTFLSFTAFLHSNLTADFCHLTSKYLGRALEYRGPNLFDTGVCAQVEVLQIWRLLRVTDPSFDTLLTFAQGTADRQLSLYDRYSAIAAVLSMRGRRGCGFFVIVRPVLIARSGRVLLRVADPFFGAFLTRPKCPRRSSTTWRRS
jgi:hypothetical protein